MDNPLGFLHISSAVDSDKTLVVAIGNVYQPTAPSVEIPICVVISYLANGETIDVQRTGVSPLSFTTPYDEKFHFAIVDAPNQCLTLKLLNTQTQATIGQMTFNGGDYLVNQISGMYAWFDPTTQGNRKIEAPALSAPGAILINGRVGPNNVINGTYDLIGSQLFGGRVCYINKDSDLFLYYHPDSAAWLISPNLGNPSAPAYVASTAMTPNNIQGIWNVAAFGRFEVDANIRIATIGHQKAVALNSSGNASFDRPRTMAVGGQKNRALRRVASTSEHVRKPSLTKRTNAFKNIISSETSFRHDLVLLSQYAEVLKKHVTADDAAVILRNSHSILAITQHFIDGLSDIINHVEVEPVGEFFSHTADHIIEEYSLYVEAREDADATLKRVIEENEMLKKLLTKMSIDNHGQRLEVVLHRPLRRAAEYPALFNAAADETPVSHPDYALTQEAAGKIRWLPRDLQQREKKYIAGNKVLDDIVVPKEKEFRDVSVKKFGRTVIHHGDVERSPFIGNSLFKRRSGSLISLRGKSKLLPSPAVLVLCSDAVIMFRESDKMLELPPTPLAKVQHQDGKDNTSFLLLLDTKMFTITLPTSQQCLGWRSLIDQQIKAAAGLKLRESTASFPEQKATPKTPSRRDSGSFISRALAKFGSSHTDKAEDNDSSDTEDSKAIAHDPPPVFEFTETKKMLNTLKLSGKPFKNYGPREIEDLEFYLDNPISLENEKSKVGLSLQTLLEALRVECKLSKAEKNQRKKLDTMQAKRHALQEQLAELETQIAVLEDAIVTNDSIVELSAVDAAQIEWNIYNKSSPGKCESPKKKKKSIPVVPSPLGHPNEDDFAATKMSSTSTPKKHNKKGAPPKPPKGIPPPPPPAPLSTKSSVVDVLWESPEEEKVESDTEIIPAEEVDTEEISAAAARAAQEEAEECLREVEAAREEARSRANSVTGSMIMDMDASKPPSIHRPGSGGSVREEPQSEPVKAAVVLSPIALKAKAMAESRAEQERNNSNRSSFKRSPSSSKWKGASLRAKQKLESQRSPVKTTAGPSSSSSSSSSSNDKQAMIQAKMAQARAEALRRASMISSEDDEEYYEEDADEDNQAAIQDAARLGLLLAEALRKKKSEKENGGISKRNGTRNSSLKSNLSFTSQERASAAIAASGFANRSPDSDVKTHKRRKSIPLQRRRSFQSPQLSQCAPGQEVQALFTYSGDDISFDAGEKLTVIEKPDPNWWKVKKPDGSSGLCPVNYIDLVDKNGSFDFSRNTSLFSRNESTDSLLQTIDESNKPVDLFTDDEKNRKSLARVSGLYAYEEEGGGLSFQPGEEMDVLENVDENWMRVRKVNGGAQSIGLAPNNYVKPLENGIAADETNIQSEEHPNGDRPLEAEGNDDDEDDDSVSGNKSQLKAMFDYTSEGGDFSFVAGEKMNVIETVDDNWIQVCKPDGTQGLAPANYVEPAGKKSSNGLVVNGVIGNGHASSHSMASTVERNDDDDDEGEKSNYTFVTAAFDFSQDGFSFAENDNLTILEKVDENWYRVQLENGDEGLAPASYLHIGTEV